MRPLAVIRPQPGWDATAQAARDAGLTVVGHPLSRAVAVPWTAPAGDYDAILAGSGAVFRLGGGELTGLRHLPVLAVGEATASAARAAGFTVAAVGAGGLQAVLDGPGKHCRRLLRLAGEERVDLNPAEGQTVDLRTVYRIETLPIDKIFAGALVTDDPLVAIHSAGAARHFGLECDRLGLSRAGIEIIALGPRIAAAAGPKWAAVHSAASPSDTALIGKAAALCKNPPLRGNAAR